MLNISFLNLAFAALVVWIIYLTVESFRQLNLLQGELGRKAIHIGLGVFIATTPVFMNRTEIIVLNWALLIGLLILSRVKFFEAYEDVQRWSIGQYLYPLAIIFSAFVFTDALIFSFIALELALADGFAAIFGSKYGYRKYYVFGGEKTFLGSSVFFMVTMVLLTTFLAVSGSLGITEIALLPLIALSLTMIEAIFAGGFDNLILPIITGVILQSL